MFSKILSGFVVLMMIASFALAAPKAFEGYIKKVAKESGKEEEEVRKEAIEALERKGVKKEDLDRIGKKDTAFENKKQLELINLLKEDTSFTSKFEKTTTSNVAKKTGKEFKAYAEKENGVSGGDLIKIDRFAEGFGLSSANVEALKQLKPEARDKLVKIGNIILKRVAKNKMPKEVAEKLIVAGKDSVKLFKGTVYGDNISEACLEMRHDALGNLADFIERANGARVNDAKEYTDELAKAAAEKFKQDFEDGKARICALAGAECNLFTTAIRNACQKGAKSASR